MSTLAFATGLISVVGNGATAKGVTTDSLYSTIAPADSVEAHLEGLESLSLGHIWTKPIIADSLSDSLMNFAKSVENEYFTARSYFFKGMIKYRAQKLEPAFEWYTESRKILETIDQPKALAELYHNIGLIYFRFNDREKCLDFLGKAIEINKKHGFIEQWMKNEIALTAIQPGRRNQINGYKRIGELSKENGYQEGQFISLINVATLLNNNNEPDSALMLLGQAEALHDSTGFDKYIENIYQLKGLIFKRQKKLPEAKKYLEKALAVNLEKQQNGRVLELYLNLSGLHEDMNDYKTAHEYLNKHRILRYEFDLQKKEESVAKIEADYRVELKEQENKLLRKDAELADSQLKTATRQRILLGIILFMSILAIGLLAARYNSRQRHLKEQEQINQRLNELNHEMESVLQVVSHDFRTPLAKIKMLGELMQNQEADLSENMRDKLVKVGNSVREAEDLVSDILEIKSFYQEDELISDPEGFSVKAEVQSVIDQFAHPIQLKDLDVSYEHDGEEAVVHEKDKLKRIVSNLLSNAVKFTETGTSIKVSSDVSDGKLIISIADEGPGFSQQEQKDLFTKFANFSNKPIAWGTSHGLGLFIVKKLVDRLGGTITLNSKKGKGAEFVMEFDAVIS